MALKKGRFLHLLDRQAIAVVLWVLLQDGLIGQPPKNALSECYDYHLLVLGNIGSSSSSLMTGNRTGANV